MKLQSMTDVMQNKQTICFNKLQSQSMAQLIKFIGTKIRLKLIIQNPNQISDDYKQDIHNVMKKQNFIYPPDFQKSQKHRRATRIFKGLQQDQTTQECECCGRRIGTSNTKSKCCYSDLQLSFLGPGLPLFFTYIKVSIAVLVILSLIFCVFALITNGISKDCQSQQRCTPNIFNKLSIINKTNQDAYLSVQNYVLLGFVVCFMISMQIFRYVFRKIIVVCDLLIDSPSDYAVMVSRLPPLTTQADINAMISEQRQYLTQQQRQRTQNLRVIKIILGYRMGRYLQTLRSNKRAFRLSVQQHHDFYPQQLPQLKQPGSMAIIVFAHQQSKNIFLYKSSCFQKCLACVCDPCTPLSYHTIYGEKISVQRAPQPDDIIWENTNITIRGGVCRKVIYNSLCFCILLAGGAAQYGLAVFQTRYTDQLIIFYIGIASSLLVAIMNQIIYQFLLFSASRQRKQTRTQININLIIKIGFFLFLNAGVFMVAAKILANIHDFHLQGTLSLQVTQIMILNAITPHLSLLATDHLDIVGRMKRFVIKRQLIFATQLYVNIAYQKPIPQISYKYGYLIRTMWLTALYCPLTPIVVPISVIGLIVNLYIQKCLHSQSYRCPNMVSSTQNEVAVQLLQFFPLIMSCGQFIIYLYFRHFRVEQVPDYWAIPIYMSMALSVLQVLLPVQSINKCLIKISEQQQSSLSYEQVQQNFQVTYEMVNPAYKCTRRRKRDKIMLQSIYGRIQEMVTIKSSDGSPAIKQLLIRGADKIDNTGNKDKHHMSGANPLHVLLMNQNLFNAFNSNMDY